MTKNLKRKEGSTIHKRRFIHFALAFLGIAVLFFSGCRTFKVGKYKISGRVTDVEGRKGIPGVRINYEINYSGWRYTWTPNSKIGNRGDWSIRANEGDRVLIRAEKDNFTFQPSFYDIEVGGDRSDLNFELSRWEDDFADSESGWDPNDENTGYYNGEYWLEVVPPGYTSIKTLAPYAAPTSYSIEAKISSFASVDGYGGYGLVFNITDYSNYYYVFRVHPQGDQSSGYVPYWELCKVNITGTIHQGSLLNLERIAWGTDPHRNRIDPNVNYLKVQQDWRNVKLYIGSDSRPVWEDVIDAETTDTYKYGLYAWTNSGSPYVAWFDNFIFTAIGFKKVRLQTSQFSTLSTPTQNLITSKDIEL